MDEVQKQRAIGVITHITCELARGVRHFDRSGRKLKTVSAIIEAWARGGELVVKEPERSALITRWTKAK